MVDSSPLHATRESLLRTSGALVDARLNVGTAGNVSVRCEGGLLITPSGRHPRELEAVDMVRLTLDGSVLGAGKPSSEWRFHCALYRVRPDAGAIVHMHSPYATTLSCQRRDLPAFHYSVARFGGGDVRCAPYAVFGSVELSEAVVVAMQDRSACLMANHGATLIGRDLATVLADAIEFEYLCELYWRTLQGGQPVLLDTKQMREVELRFRNYCEPSSPT
ncbi:MAG: class II aldolase/adducin family protein [Xanthomonadales bacterium]|nr:L-fuculose phosphate aldolase [Xanthomonadales bacterium]MCC6592188.1 class II aldolase/adducin family protein [Xanthomonadales bacterium]MCE7932370.1 class II aldolase/adducin family protein [Xanthomonadales bacterium PRO6]